MWITIFSITFLLSCTEIFGDDSVKTAGNRKCDPESSFCPENTAEGISYIREWWNKVSVQKPIKCQKSDFFKPEIDQALWSLYDQLPVISSRKCNVNETSVAFEVRGSGIRIENGILEGAGKLIILPDWPKDIEAEERNRTCLRVFSAGGHRKPVEVIGTFQNGYLEGNVKLKMDDGAIIIAQFRRSAISGFRREWDINGTLTFVGYRYRDSPVGHCWGFHYDKLVYQDCSSLGRPQSNWALMIPFNSTLPAQDISAGTYNSYQAYLDNVHEASFSQMSSTDDCVLQVDFKVGEDQHRRHFLAHKDNDRLSTIFDKDKSLCNFATEDDKHQTVPDQLLKWFTELEEYFFANPINTITRMKPQDKPVDQDTALILIPQVTFKPNENGSYARIVNVTVMNGTELPFHIHNLHLDSSNRFHGFNEISLDPKADPNLVATDPTLGWRVNSIKGYFVDGYLEGPSYVQLQDGRWLIGMVKRGVLHGPVMVYGTVQILPGRKTQSQISSSSGFGCLGQYLNGRAVGDFWIGMKGNGYLHGKLDPINHTVTGDNIAYIYPDRETSFLGKFENKFMRSAQESSVQELGCTEDGMIVVTKYSEPSGPFFYYDPPTNESYGAGPPNVRDPYERKWLDLRPSNIQGAGEGVFVLRDVPSNRAVSLYSGFLYDYPVEAELYKTTRVENTSLSDEYRRACKKYSLGLASYSTTIDIPPEMDLPGMFQPTLGPKVNHHFRLNNSAYVEIEHPRWGTIQSVTTILPVKAGDELFTYYGYGKTAPFPADFLWYWETKASIDRQERLEREAKEKEEKALQKKQEENQKSKKKKSKKSKTKTR